MKEPDIKFIDKPYRSQLMIHDRYKLMPQAVLAVELVKSLMIGAIPDGETSSGESAHRLLTPVEIVTKAVATAELVYAEIEAKRWVLEVPSLTELDALEAVVEPAGFRVDNAREEL
jgi:hypothetical protein